MEPCLFRHGKLTRAYEEAKKQTASMEPCLFRHGKLRRLRQGQRAASRLQWSHVFSDMVRLSGMHAIPDVGIASMEPCLFRHGKSAILMLPNWQQSASMEPCLFRHGKVGILQQNYAVIMLQWSHVFSDMVSARSSRIASAQAGRFNGAMSFQTW